MAKFTAMTPRPESITELLHAWTAGDRSAADRIVAATYGELRQIAAAMLRRERSDHTLQATELLHEAYVRLMRGPSPDIRSKQAFFALMANQMKWKLVDHARARGAAKRGGGVKPVPYTDVMRGAEERASLEESERFIEDLDRALDRLAVEHPRCAEVMRLRFYAGLTVDAIAQRLKHSAGTIKRDLALGRAWLLSDLTGERTRTAR